jgi:hypothetical protein
MISLAAAIMNTKRGEVLIAGAATAMTIMIAHAIAHGSFGKDIVQKCPLM